MRRIIGDWLQVRPCSLDPLVVGASHTLEFKVYGVPAGLSVTEAEWSVKDKLSDLDSARKLTKLVTPTLSAQGAITAALGGANVEGYLLLAAADVLSSFPPWMEHDLWLILSNGMKRQVARGDVTIAGAVTLVPGSADAVATVELT